MYFNSQFLVAFENKVKSLDLITILDVQSVCIIKNLTNKEILPIYDFLFIDTIKLSKIMKLPNKTNRFLHYLVSLFDSLILEMIYKNTFRRPIGININPDTVLSKNFEIFHKELSYNKNSPSIVIELNAIDYLSNKEKFLKSMRFLEKLNYRLCINDITQHDSSISENNLLKLSINSNFLKTLKVLDKEISRNRIILTDCDNLQSIQLGLSSNISLFQGAYFDNIANQNDVNCD